MAKLNRDKTQEMKELLVQQETLKEFVDNLSHKLQEEKDKFDKLTDQKITVDEKLRLLKLALEEDNKVVDEQKRQLDELNKMIADEEKKVRNLEDKVKPARELKSDYEDKNRILLQNNNTAKAKKEWIEKTYNYHENVDKMEIGIFNKIVETNKSVNDQVDAFNKKLMEVQVEFQKAKFEARAKTN